ncbi:MAG TPA: hypothetical protein VNY05_39915 [Candidatus Acidoferrales bacterium]|nr:hypothetical protein [Candidatus Acidoferrales bacterium]
MPRQQGTQTRTFTYDSFTQRVTAVQTPESGTVTYVYNLDGTVQSKTDAKGQQTRYIYETYGRVMETDVSPGGAGQPADVCQTVTYQYDTATVLESVTQRNGYGRLTGTTWSSPANSTGQCPFTFVEEYAYTAWGQVTIKRMTVNNTSLGNTPAVMEGTFQYDAEGRLSNFSTPYSSGDPVPEQNFTYNRDALGRAVGMYSGIQGQTTTTLVNGVSYNGAGRMLMTGIGETRQYNTNGQLTRLTAGGGGPQGLDLSYNYGTANNNGRVASVTDNLSGEQVTYTYDQLNRLTQALTNDAWGLSFGYDGFGNLTQQTRVQGTTAPTLSVTVDPATNRITTAGYGYDANGNVTQTPDGMTYGYDVANRMVSNGATYNPKNQRVFDGTYLYYYGVGGELIGRYQVLWGQTFALGSPPVTYTMVQLQGGKPNLYFDGRAIQLQGHGSVMTDRLGSVRVNGNGERMNYYPYGGEVGTETAEGRVKFGTYTRDSAGITRISDIMGRGWEGSWHRTLIERRQLRQVTLQVPPVGIGTSTFTVIQ